MAQIVGVHGIGQQHRGEHQLHEEWYPALLDGLALANTGTRQVSLACAFYGDLFRPPGQPMAPGDPWFDASDVAPTFEAELLQAWWDEAARTDPGVTGPDIPVLARVPGGVQRALDALSGSRFFVELAERQVIFDLKQVHRYFTEPQLRAAAIARVADKIDADTRVLVGHSLGSVVAYEALSAHADWPVRLLVTLGSPLGIRHLIFDRLHPPPKLDKASGLQLGCWPGQVHWVNIADAGDVVALVKDLRSRFGERVQGWLVHNGATAHNVRPYLTAVETGRAIASGIDD
jgi:hypothetical protein